MIDKRKLIITIFMLALTFGMFLDSSNYQFQVNIVEAGDFVPIGPVEFSTPAADIYSYLDARQSITYGSTTTDPPAGMGADSDAYTTLTEAAEYEYLQSTQLEYASFSSLPSGWSELDFTVSGGVATSDVAAGVRQLQTKSYDLSAYESARIVFYHRPYDPESYNYEVGDYVLYYYDGSAHSIANLQAGYDNGNWRTEEHTVVSSDNAFSFYIISGTATANEQIVTDNWYIYGQETVYYYSVEAVFRFDGVTQALASYVLYVDFYGSTGSEGWNFYIGTSVNPTTQIASNRGGDFNVDVSDYITSATIYLKIRDFVQLYDSIQNNVNISRVYLYTPDEPVSWYDDDWLYRKQISVVEQTGAGTNYQVQITGYYNDSTKDVAGSVDFEALCETDFDDIRFTDNNGTTLLDYWIDNEGYSAGTSAKFWVEVKDDISNTADDVKIFVYFGNSAATAVSNGTNTFWFFDDFEDNDLTEWTVHDAQWSVQTTTVKYGTYAAYCDSDTTNRYMTHQPDTDYTTGFLIHCWQRFQSTSTQIYMVLATVDAGRTAYPLFSRAASLDWEFYDSAYSSWEDNTVGTATWYKIELAFDFTNSVFRFWKDSVSKGTKDLEDGTNADISTVDKVSTASPNAANRDVWMDNYYIRKFVATEPSFAAPAALEYQDLYAPLILHTTFSPVSPTTSTGATLFAIVSDADTVAMHSVYFTAIAYPIGFVGSDFNATEIGVNTWSYSFAFGELIAGVYCFEAHAADTKRDISATYSQYQMFQVSEADPDLMTGYIVMFNTLGEFIPYETFAVYRNGERQYSNTFTCYETETQNITVVDRWGETLNTTTFDAGTVELVPVIEVYSLKFANYYTDWCYFNISKSGLTYTEAIAPLEIVPFRLYTGAYTYGVNFRNGSGWVVSGNINLTNSTAIIITGDGVSDLIGMIENIYTVSNNINITVNTIEDNTYLIQLMFDWTNTTIYNQTITILAAFDWTNTTIYNQTLLLASAFNATNTVLYNQIILIQNMFNWENTTLFNQTISILNAFNATNTVLYEQTVYLLANISNVNSTIYAQTVSILADIVSVNTTLYTQTVNLLANITNVNTTLYTQTLTILADILNVNTTLYNQAVYILANLTNVNTSLYTQTVNILTNIANLQTNITVQTLNVLATILNVNMTLYNQTVYVLANISNMNTTIYTQLILEMAAINNLNATIYSQVITQLLRIYQKPLGGGYDDALDMAILTTLQGGLVGLVGMIFIIQVPAVQDLMPGKRTKKKNSYPAQLIGNEFTSTRQPRKYGSGRKYGERSVDEE